MDQRNGARQGNGSPALPVDRNEWVAIVERCNYHGPTIRRRLGITRNSLSWHLRKHGIRLYPKFNMRTREHWQRLIAEYDSSAEAARRLGIRVETMRNELRRHGIDYRQRSVRQIEPEVIHEIFRSHGTVSRTAKVLGVSISNLQRHMKDATGEPLPRNDAAVNGSALSGIDTEEIRMLYHRHGSRAHERAGVSKSVFYKELHRRGIPLRRGFRNGNHR